MAPQVHKQPLTAVVIGGGIAGTATTMYLAEAGVQVTCVESSEQVGLETSYMNGSLACASLTQPWCSMSNLKGFIVQSLLPMDGRAKSVNVVWSEVVSNPNFWKWVLYFARFAADKNHYQYLFRSSYQLSKFSLDCMNELDNGAEDGIKHKGPARGTIQLFPTQEEQQRQLSTLSPIVEGLEKLTPLDVAKLDPVLSQVELFPGGGIFSGLDRSYDIHQLCLQLRHRAEKSGAKFLLGQEVPSLTLHRNPSDAETTIPHVELSNGQRLPADVVVVAAGNHSNVFAKQAGDGSHSWPVRGFALEVPLNKTAKSESSSQGLSGSAPQSLVHNVVDDPRRIYIAPLTSTTVRLSGFCELGSEIPNKAKPVDYSGAYELLEQARALLPTGYLVPSSDSGIKLHTCWRPQTADDLPVVGASAAVSNLYYNSGHGHLGLTRAVGCAKLLTEQIVAGRTSSAPHINMQDYRPDRFKVAGLFNIFRKIKR